MTKEIKSDDAVYPIRDSIGQNFKVIYPGPGQTKRFESYSGNQMALGSIAKGDQVGKRLGGVANVG